MQVRNWDVELGVTRVFEMQKLVGAITKIQRHQAAISSDAMLLMHHRIADFDL